MTITLVRQGHRLSRATEQMRILERTAEVAPFEQALQRAGLDPLRATGIEVLQVNVGKLCNQTCRHCHVDAGPERREIMSRPTMQACLDALAASGIATLDITGGAPEMNPHFRWFVAQARRLDCHVIDRCNLTILLAAGYEEMPEFLAEQKVEIVASLPCYLQQNTDAQRGDGVFDKSVRTLKRLNALGYGHAGTGLNLTLVYNPVGPSLPPAQATLEAAYREQLRGRYGIEFTRLFTITNMPISRFLDDLLDSGRYDDYMQTLAGAFNPVAATGVMCRTTLSVDWEGRLYDCDFNQMLELGLGAGLPRNIRDFAPEALSSRAIVTGRHCYGCAAGAGSSCQGAVAS